MYRSLTGAGVGRDYAVIQMREVVVRRPDAGGYVKCMASVTSG